MAYNPATDFLGLWRLGGGGVSKTEVPGLDYVAAAFARAGLITLSVSAIAPVVNQPTTAWLATAVPSYSGEGTLRLWNNVTDTYVAATPALFLEMLQAAAGQNGVSLWNFAGDILPNTTGQDGDYAIRTDEPGGMYGPKAAGAWPLNPLPGTTDLISSLQLDQTFGATLGTMIFRGDPAWEALPLGDDFMFLTALARSPIWRRLTALFDDVFGNVQGSLLYRGAAEWQVLAPGAAGQVLSTGGVGANAAWAARTAEFAPGTVMLFRQTAAPVGWTKQVALNDYGLRVTSGAVGTVAGSAFSAVFAQTVVGNTTLTTSQMPSHSHGVNGTSITTSAVAAAGHAFADDLPQNTSATGGDGAHNHSINLALAYVDVIIATKN